MSQEIMPLLLLHIGYMSYTHTLFYLFIWIRSHGSIQTHMKKRQTDRLQREEMQHQHTEAQKASVYRKKTKSAIYVTNYTIVCTLEYTTYLKKTATFPALFLFRSGSQRNCIYINHLLTYLLKSWIRKISSQARRPSSHPTKSLSPLVQKKTINDCLR